jgi:hypothetical protein
LKQDIKLNKKVSKLESLVSKQKINSFDEMIKFDTLKNKSIISVDDINGKLFITDNLKDDIKLWLNIEIRYDDILSYKISNCEKPEIFITKLIAFDSKCDFILKHEFLKRNIIVLTNKFKNSEDEIFKYVDEVIHHNFSKNGIFGKISHDILNKMPEFSFYTKEKIKDLKDLNNKTNELFKQHFYNFSNTQNSVNDIGNIEEQFNLLLKELEQLKTEAESKNNHLGTNIKTIITILDKLQYIKEL